MTTSRTGTASHKRFRVAVLRAGKAAGITHCPNCGVLLNYEVGRLPNSAEPDHVVPHANGGTNDPGNGRVLCRLCNQRRGNGERIRVDVKPARTIARLVDW